MKRIPSVLLMNDIHVAHNNIPEFQKNWDEALDICKQYGIADMIIGGDLWQSRSSQTLSVLMAVRQAIIKATKAGVTLTLAEGNHCKVDQESFLGYSHIFSEYPNVYVVDDYTVLDLNDNTVLYIMSYFPENGSFTEKLNKIIETDFDPKKTNLLYIHEGINGALATASEKELPTKIFADFDNVLVGHYHNRCKIKGTAIEYIGSSRQHNFGEDEDKGYTIVYNDGSYEFIKNQVNMRYTVIDLNAKDLKKGMAALEELKATGQYKVKARIQCLSTEVSQINKQQLIDAGVTRVEINTEDTQVVMNNSSLEHKYDKSGIKEEYSNYCADKGIANVEMGLRYLDRINDKNN